MPVIVPPRSTDTQDDRDLAQRVADLEALIEEARRRARRRRIRNGTAFILAAAAGVAGLIGFHGGGNGGTGTAARAGGSGARGHATEQTPPLAPLPAGNRASAFAFDPRRPNVVYVASAHARGGVFVYKTTDGGRHWLSTGAHGTGWISDDVSLTADPQHPGALYAGTDTAVYKTVDGGRSWRPFNQGLFPSDGGGRVCFRQAGARRYCVTRYVGVPGTTNWNRNNGWVLDLAVDPRHSNVVYSAAGGVRKSTDGGHTWKSVFVPTRWTSGYVSRIAIAPTRPESIYLIAHNLHNGDTAIYKSIDAGTTWHATGSSSSELPASCCGDNDDALAVNPQDPQTLYAVIGNTVLATTDGAASWQPMMNGLPANDVSSLAIDPRRAGIIYAGVQFNLNQVNGKAVHGAVYKTIDGGQTWSEVFSGSGVEKISVNPTRPSTVYAASWGGRDAAHPYGVDRLLRSTDDGRTWTVAG